MLCYYTENVFMRSLYKNANLCRVNSIYNRINNNLFTNAHTSSISISMKSFSRKSLPGFLMLKRCTSSSSSIKSPTPSLLVDLHNELQREQQHYESPKKLKQFLSKTSWELFQTDGDTSITLKKLQGDLTVTIQFQFVRSTYGGLEEEPSYSNDDEEVSNSSQQHNTSELQETTDFIIKCEKPNGNGVALYCVTLENDEKYRFGIGTIQYYGPSNEKLSATSYMGPEFNDLPENIQLGIDDWLIKIGINNELCDFIDAWAADKEQLEYMRWLRLLPNVVG